MDPCPFVRLTVSNLALKIPVPSKPPRTAVHPSSSSPCTCKIKLKNLSTQTAVVPFISPETDVGNHPNAAAAAAAATFYLSKLDLEKLAGKSIFSGAGKVGLEISVHVGKQGGMCGVLGSSSSIGKVSFSLDIEGLADSRNGVVFHNGWVCVGEKAEFHLCVKAELDPRFVFQFDGEPECSPQVFQIQGNIRQPVFTCKFSFRNPLDRTQRSSSFSLDQNGNTRTWLSSFQTDKERPGKERKGWSITVHDLSGSPVAAASMVTPFVASPGTDRVSRSNPGSWLIMRPDNHAWKPWGRLEAWRERGASDGLGYRFELVSERAAAGLVLAESTINTYKGGKFLVDLSTRSNAPTPAGSPGSSGDFGHSLWAYCVERGFVMSSSVEGEGKCSKPSVEVGVQHVGCAEDAAAFVALAAAVDLSMDACRLFSHKLRKELCQPQASPG